MVQDLAFRVYCPVTKGCCLVSQMCQTKLAGRSLNPPAKAGYLRPLFSRSMIV